jgi:hypothetical protein
MQTSEAGGLEYVSCIPRGTRDFCRIILAYAGAATVIGGAVEVTDIAYAAVRMTNGEPYFDLGMFILLAFVWRDLWPIIHALKCDGRTYLVDAAKAQRSRRKSILFVSLPGGRQVESANGLDLRYARRITP